MKGPPIRPAGTTVRRGGRATCRTRTASICRLRIRGLNVSGPPRVSTMSTARRVIGPPPQATLRSDSSSRFRQVTRRRVSTGSATGHFGSARPLWPIRRSGSGRSTRPKAIPRNRSRPAGAPARVRSDPERRPVEPSIAWPSPSHRRGVPGVEATTRRQCDAARLVRLRADLPRPGPAAAE